MENVCNVIIQFLIIRSISFIGRLDIFLSVPFPKYVYPTILLQKHNFKFSFVTLFYFCNQNDADIIIVYFLFYFNRLHKYGGSMNFQNSNGTTVWSVAAYEWIDDVIQVLTNKSKSNKNKHKGAILICKKDNILRQTKQLNLICNIYLFIVVHVFICIGYISIGDVYILVENLS